VSLYNHFKKELEKPFENFLRDDMVNEYLYDLGEPVIDDEIVISGYEIERGHWGTIYDNKVRFGKNIEDLSGLKGNFIISPNIFYGENKNGEKLVYRLGLEKKKNKIKLYPIVIRAQENSLEGRILEDLCVIFTGKIIDKENLEEIDEKNIKKISTNHQFLICFFNLDDYIRKLNPKFHSDSYFKIWMSVETFSTRIIDQILYKIIEEFKDKPEWMIKDIIRIYESNLLNKIEYMLKESDEISFNQLKFYVKNLCSYMNRFKTDEPLNFIIINDEKLLPIILDNFTVSEREAKYEAFIALNKIIDIKPEIVDKNLIDKLFKLLFFPSKKVRDNVGRIFYKIFFKIDQIKDPNIVKIIKNIKNFQKSNKDWIDAILYKFIFEDYQKIVDDSIVHQFNEIFLNTRNSQKLWDLYTIYEIIVEKYDRALPLIAEDLLEGMELGSTIAKYVSNVYHLIAEQSSRVIESIIDRLFVLIVDENPIKQDNVLAALITILKVNPKILERYKEKFWGFLKHSKSKLKDSAIQLLDELNDNKSKENKD
jgi:hypothetical protein